MRIGELSRRTGVSDHTLRAWETRYGLLRPHRSVGGFRLYSLDDESRIGRMTRLLGMGLSPAEAARVVLGQRDDDTVLLRLPVVTKPAEAVVGAPPPDPKGPLASSRHALTQALESFDDAGAHAILDRLIADLTVDAVLREVVVPFLQDQGRRWTRGEITVVQEHFASNVIRGRLAGLARGWASGTGPRAVLACPPGERHDLPLMAFGLALRHAGWRVIFLGADTPIAQIRTSLTPPPSVVVLSATVPERFHAAAQDIRELAGGTTVFVAGAGASAELAAGLDAVHLDADPVSAAHEVIQGRHPVAGRRGEVVSP